MLCCARQGVAGGVWGLASSLWQRGLRTVQGAIDRYASFACSFALICLPIVGCRCAGRCLCARSLNVVALLLVVVRLLCLLALGLGSLDCWCSLYCRVLPGSEAGKGQADADRSEAKVSPFVVSIRLAASLRMRFPCRFWMDSECEACFYRGLNLWHLPWPKLLAWHVSVVSKCSVELALT